MLLPPAAVMATWPAPNYVNPQNHGPGLFIVDITLMVVVLIVVGIRYYTRLRVTKTFGPDDFLIGVALVDTLLLYQSLFGSVNGVIDSNHRSVNYNNPRLRPLKVRPTHLGRVAIYNYVRYQTRSCMRSTLLRCVNTY